MHLGTKKLAFLGLLLALTVGCTVLSSVIEVSTFFFLAAASFLIGAAIRETGLQSGSAFCLAAILLSIILVPNKIYAVTFTLLAVYVLFLEILQVLLQKRKAKQLATLNRNKYQEKKYNFWLWFLRWIVFNVVYICMILFFPQLIFPQKIKSLYMILALVAGQFIWLLFVMAYDAFYHNYWTKIRKFLHI